MSRRNKVKEGNSNDASVLLDRVVWKPQLVFEKGPEILHISDLK